MLELHFLGAPKVIAGNEEITGAFSHKAIGILAYLVVHRNESIARERLAALFWSDSDRGPAKYNLRYTFWNINRELKSRGVALDFLCQEDKEHCKLIQNDNWVSDVILLEEMQPNQRDCKFFYRGEFLRDIRMKGNPELDNWIICERERLQKIYFEGVSVRAQYHIGNNHYEQAIACLENLLLMNPLQEDMHLKLMELYIKNQQRVQAIRQYRKCKEILRSELNISPMPEMKELFQQIVKEDRQRTESHTLPVYNASPLHQTVKDEGQTQMQAQPMPAYYGLSSLVECIEEQDPQVIDALPPAYLQEVSKLLMSRQVSGEVLSPEIEKLRIFKAVTYLLEQLMRRGSTLELKLPEKMDGLSLEFMQFNSQTISRLRNKLKITK